MNPSRALGGWLPFWFVCLISVRPRREKMEWLEPWSSTEGEEAAYLRTFADQLARETSRGHELHGKKVRLIGRGNGDDALFEILDGTGRVAEVHLVWQGRQ